MSADTWTQTAPELIAILHQEVDCLASLEAALERQKEAVGAWDREALEAASQDVETQVAESSRLQQERRALLARLTEAPPLRLLEVEERLGVDPSREFVDLRRSLRLRAERVARQSRRMQALLKRAEATNRTLIEGAVPLPPEARARGSQGTGKKGITLDETV